MANIIIILFYKERLQVNISSWFIPLTISYREILGWSILTIGINKLLGYLGALILYALSRSLCININILNSEGTKYSVGITLTTTITIMMRCIIGPVVEECIHRGIVLQRLRKKGSGFAIITSGIIFAIVHANIPPLLSYTVGGIILGYITIKTNSIVPAIIIHSMNNFVIAIQILLGDSLGQYGFIAKEVTDAVFIVIAVIIITLRYSNEKTYIQSIKYDTDIRKIFRDFLKAPLFIMVILIYIVVMGISITR